MLSTTAIATAARASLRLQTPRAFRATTATITTYSGGQPNEGQGGFYGSIKSRSEKDASFSLGLRAEPKDLIALERLMDQWDTSRNTAGVDQDAVWRELIHDPENAQMFQRLIVKGSPAWGLSIAQRAFVSQFMTKKN